MDERQRAVLAAYADYLNQGNKEFDEQWAKEDPAGHAKERAEHPDYLYTPDNLNVLQANTAPTHDGEVLLLVVDDGDDEAGPATVAGWFPRWYDGVGSVTVHFDSNTWEIPVAKA